MRYWKAYLPYWRAIRNHPRPITVKYEDLVTEPDAVQRRIHERLPFLQKTADFSRYHEVASPSSRSLNALRGVRPIRPVGIGSYRQHLGRIADQIQKHGSITADLIEFGYERDASWERILDGVTPVASQSHFPEFYAPVTFAGGAGASARKCSGFSCGGPA